MNDIRAIIFDMDGVLADSEPLHFEAEKAILQQHGIEAPWHEWHKFTGLTDEKIVGRTNSYYYFSVCIRTAPFSGRKLLF